MKTDTPDGRPANPVMRLLGNPYFLVVMTMVFWSGNAVMGRFIRDDIPPITLAFWRWTLAVLVLIIVVRPPLRRDWTELRRSWKVVVLLGTLGTSLFNTMQYVALQATTATFVVGAVQLFPLYLWEAQAVGPMTWNLKTSAAIGYIVVGSAILAYYCFAWGIAWIGANSVAPFFNLLPLFTVLLAVPFLGEQITLVHTVGMVFIVTGIRLATWAAKARV